MSRRNRWAAVVVPALIGFGSGAVAFSQLAPAQAPGSAPAGSVAMPAFKLEDPPNRGLDAALFVQTAAEYDACCLQAYNLATARLEEAVNAAKGGRKPAVVLDLDETVLDNSGYEATQLRSGLTFDSRIWDIWQEKFSDGIGLVPGAKEFLDTAARLGVTPVYISNRDERYRAQTKAALARLKLPLAADSDLKLADETTGSSKSSRREEAERMYEVLLYVGDNLRDFDDRFRFPDLTKAGGADLDAAIRKRKSEVDATRREWGKRWVILPNPVYGEWTKPLGRGRTDFDRLVPAAKP